MFGFLQGLPAVLRDSDFRGLVLVLDEVETLQRVRSDVREKSLNAIRQLLDEVDAGRFPGLYVLITGTPAFYDGTQGVQRLTPLAARIGVDFSGDARWDNPRAPQVRLLGFQQESLIELGQRIETSMRPGSPRRGSDRGARPGRLPRRIRGRGGRPAWGTSRIAPRVFLRKLIDLLDKTEQASTSYLTRPSAVRIAAGELNDDERAAVGGLDAIQLDV